MANLMKIVDFIDPQAGSEAKTSKHKRRQTPRSQDHIRFVQALHTALTKGKSQDLLAERGSMCAVPTTEQDYCNDPSMNDIIDGTFSVLGKVSRFIPEDSPEQIGLLRKTPFGRFSKLEEAMPQLLPIKQQLGFTDPMETRIGGPVMQVVLLAIFV